MLIRIDDIKDEGLDLVFEEDPDRFPVLLEMAVAGDGRFTEPVRVRAHAVRVRELVEVEGEVSTGALLACGRCLKEFPQPLQVPFALTYARELPPAAETGAADEFELSAEDLGLVLFSGDEFDLTEQIQEQLVMALPLQALCRSDCRGLCPQCGADRNETDCGCTPEVMSVKFAALKNLKIDK